jgi:hypothetical protein
VPQPDGYLQFDLAGATVYANASTRARGTWLLDRQLDGTYTLRARHPPFADWYVGGVASAASAHVCYSNGTLNPTSLRVFAPSSGQPSVRFAILPALRAAESLPAFVATTDRVVLQSLEAPGVGNVVAVCGGTYAAGGGGGVVVVHNALGLTNPAAPFTLVPPLACGAVCGANAFSLRAGGTGVVAYLAVPGSSNNNASGIAPAGPSGPPIVASVLTPASAGFTPEGASFMGVRVMVAGVAGWLLYPANGYAAGYVLTRSTAASGLCVDTSCCLASANATALVAAPIAATGVAPNQLWSLQWEDGSGEVTALPASAYGAPACTAPTTSPVATTTPTASLLPSVSSSPSASPSTSASRTATATLSPSGTVTATLSPSGTPSPSPPPSPGAPSAFTDAACIAGYAAGGDGALPCPSLLGGNPVAQACAAAGYRVSTTVDDGSWVRYVWLEPRDPACPRGYGVGRASPAGGPAYYNLSGLWGVPGLAAAAEVAASGGDGVPSSFTVTARVGSGPACAWEYALLAGRCLGAAAAPRDGWARLAGACTLAPTAAGQRAAALGAAASFCADGGYELSATAAGALALASRVGAPSCTGGSGVILSPLQSFLYLPLGAAAAGDGSGGGGGGMPAYGAGSQVILTLAGTAPACTYNYSVVAGACLGAAAATPAPPAPAPSGPGMATIAAGAAAGGAVLLLAVLAAAAVVVARRRRQRQPPLGHQQQRGDAPLKQQQQQQQRQDDADGSGNQQQLNPMQSDRQRWRRAQQQRQQAQAEEATAAGNDGGGDDAGTGVEDPEQDDSGGDGGERHLGEVPPPFYVAAAGRGTAPVQPPSVREQEQQGEQSQLGDDMVQSHKRQGFKPQHPKHGR